MGQVTGAVPSATSSPFTFMVTLSGPRGTKSGWFVSISIFTLPGGSCSRADLCPLDLEEVVLAAEDAVLDEAGDAGWEPAQLGEHVGDVYWVIGTFLFLWIAIGPKIALLPFVEITAAHDTKSEWA